MCDSNTRFYAYMRLLKFYYSVYCSNFVFAGGFVPLLIHNRNCLTNSEEIVALIYVLLSIPEVFLYRYILTSFIVASSLLSPSFRQPLSRQVIDRITANVRQYGDLSSTEQTEHDKRCIICMDDYTNMDNVIILPCQHIYHSQCVRTWFEHASTCPVCRRPPQQQQQQQEPESESESEQYV